MLVKIFKLFFVCVYYFYYDSQCDVHNNNMKTLSKLKRPLSSQCLLCQWLFR